MFLEFQDSNAALHLVGECDSHQRELQSTGLLLLEARMVASVVRVRRSDSSLEACATDSIAVERCRWG